MQNLIPKFRQCSIIFKKPGHLSEKWKLWRAPTTIEFNIFCLNFAYVSYSAMSAKGCSQLFKILHRSWVTNKNVKKSGLYTLTKIRLLTLLLKELRNHEGKLFLWPPQK